MQLEERKSGVGVSDSSGLLSKFNSFFFVLFILYLFEIMQSMLIFIYSYRIKNSYFLMDLFVTTYSFAQFF